MIDGAVEQLFEMNDAMLVVEKGIGKDFVLVSAQLGNEEVGC